MSTTDEFPEIERSAEEETSKIEPNKKKEMNEKEKRKSFLIKWGGLIFIIAVIALFIFLAVSNINFGQWIANSAMWFYDKFGWWGIYIGIFTISIFGNFTVLFPVPYTIAIIVISAVVPGVNPIILGIVAGAGAGIGEVSAWIIGRGSQEMLGDMKSINRMKAWVDKGWAPIIIFIFAATPLPDDAFMIVLGFCSYSILKTLFYCFLGKVVLCGFSSALPIWLKNASFAPQIFKLFGISLQDAQAGKIAPSTPHEMITSTIMWILVIVILFLFVYIDWGKLIGKLRKNKNNLPAKDIVLGDKNSISNAFSIIPLKLFDRLFKFRNLI